MSSPIEAKHIIAECYGFALKFLNDTGAFHPDIGQVFVARTEAGDPCIQLFDRKGKPWPCPVKQGAK